MKRFCIGLFVLATVAGDVSSVSAAWNNVFQPTLFGRRRCCPAPAVAQYQPVIVQSQPVVVQAAPNPCCQPQCNTSYSQRCYYQPVTAYENRTYYEQVTTQRTEYYYQPVVTYRQSCYYDPTTCSYQQVAVPQQSYELRAKSCPVTAWVQRCAQVPVVAYQKTCYWQPQTTCCNTTYGPPIPASAGYFPQTAQPPIVTPGALAVPPIIDQNRQSGGNPSDAYRLPIMPGASWQPAPGHQLNLPTKNNAPPPPVKLDRIVVGPDATVEGQVVRSDKAPRPNAKVVFVSANNLTDRQPVTANTAGRFQVSLASGGWLVYLEGSDGATRYHSRIEVNDRPGPLVLQ